MRIIFAILIGIIALLLGLSIRTATNSSAKTDLNESRFPIQSSDRVHHLRPPQHSLKNAVDISDSTQRWLQTVAILEKAELGDMIGIAQSVGFADDQLGKLVAQRWLELDPQHFLALREIGMTFSAAPYLRWLPSLIR